MEPLNLATSATTIKIACATCLAVSGCRTLLSDNETQFTSNKFAIFVDRNNITHLRTAPFQLQSNGAAERTVRMIKDGLRKMKGGTLEHNLTRLLFNYKRTSQKTGKSPAEILMGYQID